jgi:HPt (histidine-containing phosphotransfer) domain-containing protein
MFYSCGINDFLSKPVEVRKLNAILEKWIPREKQRFRSSGRTRAEERVPRSTMSPVNAPPYKPAGDGGDLAGIPGLDFKIGKAYSGGSIEGYRVVLSAYCRDMENTAKRIQNSLEEENYHLYTTLLHALKGASRTIGAADLGDAAAELEDAGRREDIFLMQVKTEGLLAYFAKLAGSIKRALEADSDKTGISASTEFKRLKTALTDNDYLTVNHELTRLGSLPLDKAAKELLSRVEHDVLLYEFEAAAAKLG